MVDETSSSDSDNFLERLIEDENDVLSSSDEVSRSQYSDGNDDDSSNDSLTKLFAASDSSNDSDFLSNCCLSAPTVSHQPAPYEEGKEYVWGTADDITSSSDVGILGVNPLITVHVADGFTLYA